MPDATHHSRRVMLVDDSADFRMLLRDGLRDRGCEIVAEAENGAQAIELAREIVCDRIVMDFRMPVLDGVQATREINAVRPDLEIIAFTDSGETAADFHDAGARTYFSKTHFGSLLDHVARPL
jgi:two-component system, chemotaxis family, chemotaxis protein CheY